MTDINDVMPKIPSMKWGALMNKAPTSNKVEELNKIFLEVIIGNNFDTDALKILKRKKKP